MKKILTIGASNSSNSINRKFANYAAGKIQGVEQEEGVLSELDLPLFSVDLVNEIGVPSAVQDFMERIKGTDGIVLSLAEYNGLPTPAFKNLIDWLSMVDKNIWQNKPMFLLSTSPGAKGGSEVLSIMLRALPVLGADIVAHFSLPLFLENFSEQTIVDPELKEHFNGELDKFKKALSL